MMTDQPWIWLDSHCLILYHWRWFDPGAGEVISGWSQHGELDAQGSVHLVAEISQRARSLKVEPAFEPIVTPHTFTGLTQLPRQLTEDDGTPLPWIRALLDAYGWAHDTADEERLAWQPALNLERAAGQGGAARIQAHDEEAM
jgi:hypothetical protein